LLALYVNISSCSSCIGTTDGTSFIFSHTIVFSFFHKFAPDKSEEVGNKDRKGLTPPKFKALVIS
jgi:hypothetical protein